MLTINDFCEKFGACEDGKRWGMANCESMQQAWDTARPDWTIWIATRDGVLTDKELRLFAVFCARQVQHLLTDERSRQAIDVAERFAYGNATQEELAAASDAASDAASFAASDAARAASYAASDAARAAARYAARYAARAASDAARAAASFAARAASYAASDAARAAASFAARAASYAASAASFAQSTWLRENTKPNWS